MKISKESSGINLVDSENSIYIWIFRVVSLFSYQGSSLSLYRVSKIYYIKSFLLCQHFFSFSFCFFIASTNIILSNPFGFVKSFFDFFWFFCKTLFSDKMHIQNPRFFHFWIFNIHSYPADYFFAVIEQEGDSPRPFAPPLMRFRKRRFGCSRMCLCLALPIPNSKHSYPLLSVSNLPSNKQPHSSNCYLQVSDR